MHETKLTNLLENAGRDGPLVLAKYRYKGGNRSVGGTDETQGRARGKLAHHLGEALSENAELARSGAMQRGEIHLFQSLEPLLPCKLANLCHASWVCPVLTAVPPMSAILIY